MHTPGKLRAWSLSLALTAVGLIAIAGALSRLSRRPHPAGSRMVSARAPSGQPSSGSYHTLPVFFEPNAGQANGSVRYFSHLDDCTLAISSSGATIEPGPQTPSAETGHSSRRAPALPTGLSADRDQPAGALTIGLQGAAPDSLLGPGQALGGHVNYLIGNDPAKWRTDIPIYGEVIQSGVWPGIDLVYHGGGHGLEYDFVISPGADPKRIGLALGGADRAEIGGAGDLLLHSGAREVRMLKPFAYQERNGVRSEVASSYALSTTGGRAVASFRIGGYDSSRPLVIDPTLSYSSYLNGTSAAIGYAVATDNAGQVYVTGQVFPPGFPVTFPGQCTGSNCPLREAFVIKINPSLSGDPSVVYATYLGGTTYGGPGFTSFYGGSGAGIAADSSGDAYVTGFTESGDFPVTASAYQSQCAVGDTGCGSPFVTELNPAGSGLIYSTYLGGHGTASTPINDEGGAIAIDGAGKIYVTGNSGSPDFPTTQGAFRTIFPTVCGGNQTQGCENVFVSKLDPTLSGSSSLVFSTFLGSADNIAVNAPFSLTGIAAAGGKIYVAGTTASDNFPVSANALATTCEGCPDQGEDLNSEEGFVSVLDPSQTGPSELVYSTYLGGDSGLDFANAIAVTSSGTAWVTGGTASSDFPLTSDAFQKDCLACDGTDDNLFATEIDPSKSGQKSLVYSTYLGGRGYDFGDGVAVAGPIVYLTGSTQSPTFPVTADAYENQCPVCEQGNNSGFLTELDATLSGKAQLVYSTFLGASAGAVDSGIAIDNSGTIYIAGMTGPDFPTTSNAFEPTCNGCGVYSENAFVAVFSGSSGNPSPSATPTPGSRGALSVSPNPVDFDSVGIGTSSSTELTITDSSASVVKGNVVTSKLGDGFSVTMGAGSFKLASGDSRIVAIKFAPTKPGMDSGTIQVTGVSPTIDVSVTGTGQPGTLSLSSSSLDFGSMALHATAKMTLSIADTGSGDLTGAVNAAKLKPPFTVKGAGSFKLHSGESHAVIVSFTPAKAKAYAGSLTVTSNDPHNPSATVGVSGTGD
jgi:hypothetical protein